MRENRADVISLSTLIVAILSGLGAGLLGTWARIRHERDEAFRERQITAADDLSTGVLQAIIGLEDAHSACLNYGFLTADNRLTIRDPTGQVPSEIEEAFRQARGLIGEARARSARVALLFGPVSAPDRAVTLAFHGLDGAIRALDSWPTPDLKDYSSELASARKYLQDFNEWALRDAKGPPWFSRWRIGGWIRSPWLRWRRRRLERKGA